MIKLKWTVHTKLTNLPSCLQCCLSYRLFWCELSTFVDISCKNVSLLLNITELNCTCLVLLKAPKKYI